MQRIDYGPGRSQFGELTLPAGHGPVRGTVVVIHGGFWRSAYGIELGRPLAADLAAHGYAAWNVEYRRVGGTGDDAGGWTATFDDVAAAVDLLAGPVAEAAGGRIDPARSVALGHSAGGQLAVWAASRPGLAWDAPGNEPAVRLLGAVSQAGVLDLVRGAELGVGNGAIEAFLGGTLDEVPWHYAVASPVARLPIGVPVVCVHGTADTNVPFWQSDGFVESAMGAARLVTLEGADHFALIDPTTAAWRACRDAVASLFA
jgi:acetyl esterase/lipase